MFELASPWVLIGLPLPLLIWFLIPRVALQLPFALKVPFYNAMLAIIDKKKTALAGQGQIRLLFLIWCLLLLAATGPRWVGEPKPLTREGRNIMLALDLSGSMELTDMLINGRPVSRLAVVKRAAEQFVQARTGDRIGLILFGTHAYLQTPLTYDRQNVLLRLKDATVGLAGQTTSIGDAIGLAVKRLQDVLPNHPSSVGQISIKNFAPASPLPPFGHPLPMSGERGKMREVFKEGRMIILLTDGANNSGVLPPLKAAELAQLDHIKIYTIGLGAESGSLSGGLFFNPSPASDLDEETLQEVAKITGGRYFRATDTQSLHAIYETINQLETVRQDQASLRPQHDYYPWPLALALLLLLYWLGERGGLTAFLSRREAMKT